MRIPAFPSIPVVSTANLEKLQQASSKQDAAALKPAALEGADAGRSALAASFTTAALSRSSSFPSAQDGLGGSAGLLNSLVEKSLKMQAIHNDASIPPEVKKRLLKPLEEANKNAMDIANAKAEQEEKSKILEASSKDAEAIRKAGEEIAASAEAKSTLPDLSAPVSNNETVTDTQTAAAGSATQARAVSAPAPESHSPVYSASPSVSPVGDSVDTHA